MKNVLYIINPAGHGGAGLKAWNEFKSLWPNEINSTDIIITKRPGHAREIAMTADGYQIIAAVGGDGTVGEVMSAIMDRQEDKPVLAIIPAGTGNDIARNVGISSIQDAVNALQKQHIKTCDIMHVETQLNGKAAHKYAFLSVAVGFSCIPMIKPWMKRLLGPKGAYYLATLIQACVYKPTTMTLDTEQMQYQGKTWLFLIGNVEASAGGSMCFAPGAKLDDGELNISIFKAGSRIKMTSKIMPKIASGEHVKLPEVMYFQGKKFKVDSDVSVVVELDGDLFGTTPAVVTVCPLAINILTPGVSP